MARNYLGERLKVIRNQKEMYKLKIKILEEEELKILEDMEVME